MSTDHDHTPNTAAVLRIKGTPGSLIRYTTSIQAGTPTTGIQVASVERMTFAALASAELPPIDGTIAFRNEPEKPAKAPSIIAYAEHEGDPFAPAGPRMPGFEIERS